MTTQTTFMLKVLHSSILTHVHTALTMHAFTHTLMAKHQSSVGFYHALSSLYHLNHSHNPSKLKFQAKLFVFKKNFYLQRKENAYSFVVCTVDNLLPSQLWRDSWILYEKRKITVFQPSVGSVVLFCLLPLIRVRFVGPTALVPSTALIEV